MNNNNYFFKAWEVIYPFAMYYAVNLVAMYIALFLMGTNAENYMVAQIFGAGVTIPMMLKRFYIPDRMYLDRDSIKNMKTVINGLAIAVIAFLLGTGLNNIIAMTPLLDISEGYKTANEYFYSGNLFYELLGAGIMVPILEEIVFRGIVFYRIKRSTGRKWMAIIVSSLMFSAIHFNIVQFVYALVLGIALALFMEKTDHIYGAIVGHMVINIAGVLRTEFNLFTNMVDRSTFAWGTSIGMFAIGLVLLGIYGIYQEK
ncbi:MAG: type II CAAX endopeptidase family protein [Agathobacter sp.]|nr:type II CAAX endopeptidase family protein [Agathobacter sp.]